MLALLIHSDKPDDLDSATVLELDSLDFARMIDGLGTLTEYYENTTKGNEDEISDIKELIALLTPYHVEMTKED